MKMNLSKEKKMKERIRTAKIVVVVLSFGLLAVLARLAMLWFGLQP